MVSPRRPGNLTSPRLSSFSPFPIHASV
jgi:hypothetical protein